MRKATWIFLIMIIVLSLCGCDTNQNMIGTRFGVVYFNEPKNISKIVCTYDTETQEKEMKIEDVAFIDELCNLIRWKRAGSYFCDCMGDYQITIDDTYLLYLHPDKIVIYTDIEERTGFTVECSQEETRGLYDIIESEK